MKRFLLSSLLILLCLILPSGVIRAYTVPPLPENGIYDPNQVLSQATIDSIQQANGEAALTSLKPQVAVMVVDSLEGESIESVANQVATTWQVGFAETDAGVLFLIAIEDREYRFEVSDNASEYLTDLETYYIGENNKHYLRSNQYDMAIRQIVADMFTELEGGTSTNSSFNPYQANQNFEAEHGVDPATYYQDIYGNDDSYESTGTDNNGLMNIVIMLLTPFAFVLRLFGYGGGGNSRFRTGSSGGSSFRSVRSSGSRIGRGGGGFSGRGSSGRW